MATLYSSTILSHVCNLQAGASLMSLVNPFIKYKDWLKSLGDLRRVAISQTSVKKKKKKKEHTRSKELIKIQNENYRK